FVLAAGTAAHADPLTALLFGAAFASTTAGAVVSFLFSIAFSLGVSLLQKALTPKPREPGIQGEITVGGDNPLSFVMGHFATAGQLEYVNTWGAAGKTPNAYITHVISLSDLPLHALTGLWVNDQLAAVPTMTGSPPT